MELRRVAITGINAISGIGNNIEEMWDNLLNGKTGIEKFDLCGDSDMAPYAARVKNLPLSEEYFDHKSDPWQLKSTAAQLSPTQREGLQASLASLMECAGQSCPHPARRRSQNRCYHHHDLLLLPLALLHRFSQWAG